MDGFQSKTAGRGGLNYPFAEDVPATGTVKEVGPGIYWVRMPLPFSLKWINLWLIDDGPGWTIVDTGMPLEDTRRAWREIFEDRLDGRPVTRIIVTHMHPDHVGNAGWLSRKFPGARLFMSRLEYISCRMLVADTGREAPEDAVGFYRRAGWDEAALEDYKSRFGGFGRGVSRMPDAYYRLEDGDRLEMAGETWQVITGHGHSPEHVCLFCPALGLLISGDQLLPRISSNVSVFPTEPEANPLADWMESCDKLIRAIPEDVLVLPAHNGPFHGAHKRLRHLIDGHELSLERLKSRLADQPRQVVQTFPALFGRKIGPDVLSMATGEAIAHLNCLIARGEARRETG
ncbi:MAG: MBL fold metallo-hydrolase, partial [Alphaproteobacteria bacterium]|nr:MBL fold metallo-hydrolase [Alphaproteobacteria bacterium]